MGMSFYVRKGSCFTGHSSEHGSQVLAFVDNFRAVAFATLAIVPFVFSMKKMRTRRTEAVAMH